MSECVFCTIIQGGINTPFTYQSGTLVAIKDINPQAPFHQLIIPRRHIPTLVQIETDDAPLLGEVFLAAKVLAADNGLSEKGFRIVANCGRDGGQTVDHLHFHLLGGRPMRWPPG